MKDAPTPSVQGALEGLVVLDLAGPLGNYSGKLFSDMGGDVILVEPRGGSPRRSAEPLAANGASLTFAYENAGKRSIALDLGEDRGRQTFLALAARPISSSKRKSRAGWLRWASAMPTSRRATPAWS